MSGDDKTERARVWVRGPHLCAVEGSPDTAAHGAATPHRPFPFTGLLPHLHSVHCAPSVRFLFVLFVFCFVFFAVSFTELYRIPLAPRFLATPARHGSDRAPSLFSDFWLHRAVFFWHFLRTVKRSSRVEINFTWVFKGRVEFFTVLWASLTEH